MAPFTEVVGGTAVQVYWYEIKLITFTNYDGGENVADRCEQTIHFGDGDSAIAPRINPGTAICDCSPIPCGEIIINDIPNSYIVRKNVYYVKHKYAGPGTYSVWVQDPNRNGGVINMPNSDQQVFYVESRLIINTYSGANSSPVFQFDPIDRACIQQCFYHNPGAYDPDGDILTYEITYCRGENGAPIPGYTYPPGTFSIDPDNGKITWCVPPKQGEYNLAFIVHEWRKNATGNSYYEIGSVLRDMQVLVLPCNNEPPLVLQAPDLCVEAGTLVKQVLTVTDPQNSPVDISGGGGAFAASSPTASLNPLTGVATYTTQFTWQTSCDHIRLQPYINTVKAQDQAPISLVNFMSFNIKVYPPSVKNLSATPQGANIQLNWSANTCNPFGNNFDHYEIYRKNNCDPISIDPCKPGTDPAWGFTKIGNAAANAVSFLDDNGGNGLVVGQDYNYVVIAVYKDGSVSMAGTGVCAKLKRDVPVLLNVDILTTSQSTGSVFIRWENALTNNGNFDTLANPGPYVLNLKYRAGNTGAFSTIYTISKSAFYLLPTTFTHAPLNTVDSDHQYQVEFIAGSNAIGISNKATSVFLSATGSDRKIFLQWASATPWVNYKYTVYRKDPGAVSFNAIGNCSITSFTDSINVKNTKTYCYKILSEGAYSDPAITKPLFNNSQEVCATAIDLIPPCTPTINISSSCLTGTVKVEWNDISKSCASDVSQYFLYKKETINDEFVRVATLTGASSTSFYLDDLTLISSCFAIQAIDSSGNVSTMSPEYCIDNCPEFELPNIITLNGDNVNDFFKAVKVRQIREIELYVYDRWGNLVYKTSDPYFKWDGTSMASGKIVSEGTLFYTCKVFEPRVTGNKTRILKGFLQVAR